MAAIAVIVVLELVTFIPLTVTDPPRAYLGIPDFDTTPLRHLLYYIELGVCGACLLVSPQVRINRLLMLFCILGSLALMTREGIGSRPVEHYLFFIVMLGLLSPLLRNGEFDFFRRNLWRMLLVGAAIDVVLSMLYYLPYRVIRPTSSFYPGFIGHSMLLSIVAAIVAQVSLWCLLYRCDMAGASGRRRKLEVGLTALCLLSGLGMTVIPGSRAALLGLVVGLTVIIVAALRDAGRRRVVAWVVGGIAVVGALTFTVTFSTVIRKFRFAEKHGSMIFTRGDLWQARWEEFKESPLIGVGFCNATRFSERFDNKVNGEFVVSEPGSSWLSMLSNVGIFAFGVFVWFNIRLVKRMLSAIRGSGGTSEAGRLALLYLSLWLTLMVHGFFEGWVLYGGSLVFMFYWLLTSRIFALPQSARV